MLITSSYLTHQLILLGLSASVAHYSRITVVQYQRPLSHQIFLSSRNIANEICLNLHGRWYSSVSLKLSSLSRRDFSALCYSQRTFAIRTVAAAPPPCNQGRKKGGHSAVPGISEHSQRHTRAVQYMRFYLQGLGCLYEDRRYRADHSEGNARDKDRTINLC